MERRCPWGSCAPPIGQQPTCVLAPKMYLRVGRVVLHKLRACLPPKSPQKGYLEDGLGVVGVVIFLSNI